MPTIRIDADGIPYWVQPIATHWDYSVDWQARIRATGDSVTSALWSSLTSGLAVTSSTYTASGMHTGWVSPSAGNAGSSYYFSSKIFTSFGRIERARIKVTVDDSWQGT